MGFSEKTLRLYAVTDRRWAGDSRTLFRQVEAALKGGATLVQLREKAMPFGELVQEARELTALCHSYGVPLIVNDSARAAWESGADGVHVGMEDAPVADIRRRAPEGFIIGATAKTVAQAQAAEAAGADYLGVGAVFPSPTKPNAIPVTTARLREICASVSIPAVAIGGITLDNMMELQGGGMAGVAVVSALFAAEDVEAAASALRRRIDELTERSAL